MNTMEITEANFGQYTEKEGIVAIDFWASWCGPCKAFAPIFEAAAAKHPDVTWAKVNTDEQSALATELGIRSIPTLMVFRDGVLLFSQPGAIPGAKLEEVITRVKELNMAEVREEISKQEKCQPSSCGSGCCC